jgi:hypothetical protein
MKVSAWGMLLFLAWTPLVVAADGCSSQHEGERCDKINNGDLDCGAGLYCKRVYIQDYQYICCPVPPATASVSYCNASGQPAPEIPEGGADAKSDADATTDAGDATSEGRADVDAASEASTDRATNDNTADMAVDIPAETTADTEDDTVPTADGDDATPDASSEAATDAADDVSSDVVIDDAEDVSDTPAADGPG